LAVEEMLATKSDIVFGTDPDCDRLGVVVNHLGRPHYLNGNQIGALFLNYIFKTRQKLGTLPKKPVVVKSIVTSPLQDVIAKNYGGEVVATLTGFKWMADFIHKYEQSSPVSDNVFASEESFGYMPHTQCRDKDGVSAVALMCEIALAAKRRGKTLVDELDEIYNEYGFHLETLIAFDYEGAEGAQKIKRIMEAFRQNAKTEFAGLKLKQLDDYSLGILGLPKSNALGLQFAAGDKLFLRPSGTEPKIKFYIMVAITKGTLEEKRLEARDRIAILEKTITQWCEKA
jgi:phosphoglucomutase